MSTLGIIGTAFRKEDKFKLTPELYSKMLAQATEKLNEFRKCFGVDVLISGGASGADHLAVILYLTKLVPKLILFLPCEFENGKFKDNGSNNFNENPGKIANYYHSLFSKVMGVNTLVDLVDGKRIGEPNLEYQPIFMLEMLWLPSIQTFF
jgi:hypothetical protein